MIHQPAQPPAPSDLISLSANHDNRIKPTSPTAHNAKPLVDLGWGNGWAATPQIVADCRAAQERGERHDISAGPTQWACCHRVECRTCGYSYEYDSGD